MVMGKFLSNLALETGMFTTYLPAYGAEVRGGTAHCMVIISDEEIFSPFIDSADTLIIMNEPSLVKFKERIKQNGTLFINKSLVKSKFEHSSARIIEVPFTDIAAELGNAKCANTVALGAYLAVKKFTDSRAIGIVLNKMLSGLSPEIITVNNKALERGMDYVRTSKS